MPRRERPQGAESVGGKGKVESLRGARPWGDFVKKYFMAGWCPLPLPPRKKSSPPTGTTGRYEMPDKKKIQGWAKERDARCNIAIRVPDNVIGIDVDAYDAKVGRSSLADLVAEFGELPPTWTLTSRSDGTSGIRFFRVPGGLHWPGEAKPDVQIVQHHHRYAVAYPSVHPDTRDVYLWYGPSDALDGHPRSVSIEHEIPSIDDLAEMPESWVEGLTSGRLWAELAVDMGATRSDIADWIKARPSGEPCRLMRKQVEAAVEEIGVGGAHDALNSRVYSLVSLSSEGHTGLDTALSRVRAAFTTEVTRPGRKGRRGRREVGSEFLRVRDGAVRIMMASVSDGESRLEEDCACAGGSIEWGEQLGVEVAEDKPSGTGQRRAKLGKAKPPDKYTRDDSGNADHLLDLLDGNAKWVAKHKNWMFWVSASGCWRQDGETGRRIIGAAQLIARRCREQADDLTDRLIAAGSSTQQDAGGKTAELIKVLNAHATKSGSKKALEDMVSVASAQSRACASWEQFDASPALLSCPNGTLELLEGGVRFRAAARKDMLSLSTRTDYVEGATSSEWDSYLDKFVPDLDVRRYLQKVAGSSLYGENRERKLFLLIGDPSSGKSTFVNALSGALGEYARTFNLSLFRANQDEKARADIVDALPRRIICTAEASAKWELHADQVKRMTGGDPISGRKLFASDFVERMPAFVPIIATNGTPSIKGADAAVRRRVVAVRFPVSMQEGSEDFKYGAGLRSSEARSAVLAWAVRGWELYCAEGLGSPPQAVLSATEDSHTAFSYMTRFLTECTVPADRKTKYLRTADLFSAWEEWCEFNRVPERDRLPISSFGEDIAGLGYPAKQKKVNGKNVRVRLGIDWVVHWRETYEV